MDLQPYSPLECSLATLIHYYRADLDAGCTCGRPPEAMHANRCGVTPIYAELFTRYGMPPSLWAWHFENATLHLPYDWERA